MRYKLAIFDFDGTLADSFPWFLGIWNQVAARYRFRQIEEHEIETLRGYDARKMIAHFGVPLWKMPLIAQYVRKLMARDIDQISLFPGVDRLLKDLEGDGVVLAIVTSNSLENVRRVLGAQSETLVRHYECGASIFGKRPKLRKVLRSSGVAFAEAICIGDEIRDIQAAHAENIAFGAVSWGYTRLDALSAYAPREIFTAVEEIREKLKRKDTDPLVTAAL